MLRQRLKDGIGVWYIEALCQGVTIGFSEVLITIWYSRQIGDAVSLGLILTLPAAIGAMTQALATRKKSFTDHPTKLACASILTQIIGLITIAAGLRYASDFNAVLVAGQCFYWMGAMTATSPTQEILAQTVPHKQHNRFFSRRAVVITVVTLACNIASAFLMDRGLNAVVMMRFVLAAAAMRMLSLALIMKKSSPKSSFIDHANTNAEPTPEALVSIVKLSLCMAFFRFAVNISSPFFSAYMLAGLGYSFSLYSLMTAIPLITKMFFLGNWGKLLDDKKTFEGLALATFFISLSPILWAFFDSKLALAGLQAISGTTWAGFDLISVLLIQHMYPKSITSKLGLYLAFGSLGTVAGGLAGGYILNHTKSFSLIFELSGIARFATGFFLLWYLRRHHLFRFHHLNLKHGLATLIAVRPSIEVAARIIPLPIRKRAKQLRKAS